MKFFFDKFMSQEAAQLNGLIEAGAASADQGRWKRMRSEMETPTFAALQYPVGRTGLPCNDHIL